MHLAHIVARPYLVSLEPTWPVLISLHHILESWLPLWKLPSGSYQRWAAGQRAGKGRQWRATKVMWGEWHRRHVRPLICEDACRWSLSPTLCVTAADGWQSVSHARTHVRTDTHTHTLTCSLCWLSFQFCCPWSYYLPLKVKHPYIVLWKHILLICLLLLLFSSILMLQPLWSYYIKGLLEL